mgnify:CR=1 FL=1
MVSFGTIAKLGSLAIAGFLGYTLLKNAGSIGSSVGSFAGTGLRSLGSGISEGFTTAFDIFGGSPNANTGGAIAQDDPNVTLGETPRTQAESNPNIDLGDFPEDVNVPSAGFTPIAKGFKPFVESGAISRGFAETYSGQPPPSSQGQLDVSRTFAYISSPTYREEQEKSGSLNNYGGYGTAVAQTEALASAIADSASSYPEWFA